MNPMKIHRLSIFTALIISFAGIGSAAQKDDLGLGIIVGEPTGVSIKYGNFPVIGIAWSLDSHFHLHCDYWAYEASLKGPVNWFVGVGGKIKFFSNDNNRKDEDKNSDIGLGVRIPLGLQYYIIPKFELFGEVAPGIALIPSTDFDIDLGIGLRYHF